MNDEILCTFLSHMTRVSRRLLHNGNSFAKATLPQADRVCGRRDQNLWQLPLLQPQWHALLSVRRGARSLLCAEAQGFQSEQVRSGDPPPAHSEGSQVSLFLLHADVCVLWTLNPTFDHTGCHVSFIYSCLNFCIHACHSLFSFVCSAGMCVVL